MEHYTIAVIDDDKGNLKIAERILSLYGYRVVCLDCGEALLEYIKTTSLILCCLIST